MEFKLIPKKDLKQVWKLQRDYVDRNVKLKEIKKIYYKFSELFVGCYEREKLIGICIPGIFNKEIYIKAVAVKKKYWRKGVGSKLLSLFEKQVKKFGQRTVDVPSASIEWVERFYLKNGYRPFQFQVRIRKSKVPRDYKNKKYKISNERIENKYKFLYIKTKRYNPRQRERIKKVFNADDVLYIMEKKLKH